MLGDMLNNAAKNQCKIDLKFLQLFHIFHTFMYLANEEGSPAAQITSIDSPNTVTVIPELPLIYQSNEMIYSPGTKPNQQNVVCLFVSFLRRCKNVGLGLKIRF